MDSRQPPHRSHRSNAALQSRVRIIGGRWRGVPLTFPALSELRPTPDRVRETLFNWLQPVIAGARCLDLFAGSGALGVEALSRGAAHVTFVDREARIGRHLAGVLQRLEADPASTTIAVADALAFLARPVGAFDIVFLDPPYAAESLQRVCERLASNGWLARDAYIYLECSAHSGLPVLPPGWVVHRAKRAGQVGYHLLRNSALTASPEGVA
jgi:16S rRNA (guanine966-N2)-methyltransferase